MLDLYTRLAAESHEKWQVEIDNGDIQAASVHMQEYQNNTDIIKMWQRFIDDSEKFLLSK